MRNRLRDEELQLFSMQRIDDFLAAQQWWQTVSTVGQTGIGGHFYSVEIAYAHQDVKFTLDAQSGEFVVKDAQELEFKRIKPKKLTVEEITGLKPVPP